MSNITFSVIDTTCESADRSFFPPRVLLTTRSTTVIATLYGFSEYIPSTPPKKYKKLTWDGTSIQTAFEFASTEQIGGAKYVWSGTTEIDSKGNTISRYSKNFYAQCPKLGPWPTVVSIPNFGLSSLVGYCWELDPNTCQDCDPDDNNWSFVQDVSENGLFDTAQNGFNNFLLDSTLRVITPTSLNDAGTSSSQTIQITGTIDLPTNTVQVRTSNNYSSQLSDEYTDTEAVNNAVVIVSNGATAENLPRTTGFVSRTTNVIYTLTLSNLINGQSYLVTVRMRDKSFSVTTRQYTVNATSATFTITDIIPTPPAGGTSTIYGATIVFAP